MTYTIKAVAEKTHLSIYTLRFYDKQGLLPFVSRNASGYREFTEGDLKLLHTITCLKATGMPLKTIRRYIDLVMQGPSSVNARQQLLAAHRQTVLEQQQQLRLNLKEIDYKLNLYRNPDAITLVGLEQQYAKAEKRANKLADPYPD